jgi:rod shape-determining protein MreC
MRYSWYLPVRRDIGVFVLLVILGVTIMALDRASGDRLVAGTLAVLFKPFGSMATTVTNLSVVHRENHYLRSMLMEARAQNAVLLERVREADRLGELLEFSARYPDSLLCSRVLYNLDVRMGGGVVIDVGTDHGVVRDMSVVCPGGLVGRIVKAGPAVSQVRRIVDRGNRVSALVTPSRATGILGTRTGGQMILEWVPPDASVNRGDTVITSGLGAVTPKGIPVGRVTGMEEHPERFSLSLKVVPFADFDRLEEVFVILREPPDLDALLGDVGE